MSGTNAPCRRQLLRSSTKWHIYGFRWQHGLWQLHRWQYASLHRHKSTIVPRLCTRWIIGCHAKSCYKVGGLDWSVQEAVGLVTRWGVLIVLLFSCLRLVIIWDILRKFFWDAFLLRRKISRTTGFFQTVIVRFCRQRNGILNRLNAVNTNKIIRTDL